MIVVTFSLRETPWVKKIFFNKILCTAKPSYKEELQRFIPAGKDKRSCILPKYLGEIYVNNVTHTRCWATTEKHEIIRQPLLGISKQYVSRQKRNA
jgi:hypothetical protein